jgi:hypothetical protein
MVLYLNGDSGYTRDITFVEGRASKSTVYIWKPFLEVFYYISFGSCTLSLGSATTQYLVPAIAIMEG